MSSKQKEAQIDFSLWGLVDNVLSVPREKKEITSWHASGLGSCPTGRYLERLGVEPDEGFDERTLRVFSAGSKFEEWILGLAKQGIGKAKIELTEQVRVEDKELGLSGYADAVVELPGGNKVVYEIKSKHSNSFHWMKKRGEGAMRQHQMQVWAYLKVLRIHEGRILYISKDDLSFLEFPVKLTNMELAKEVLDELAMLNEAWSKKLPPPVLFDEKDWRAKYCRWHKKCLTQEKYLT